MLRDGDRGRRQLGLEYRADVIDLPPGGDSIGCASRPAAAVAAPALRALICGRAEAPEPSSRHQALVHRSVFDGKVNYSGSRRAIRSALAIIERDREFVDSPLEGTGFEPSVPGNETAIARASRHRRNRYPIAGQHLLWRAGHRHRTLPLLHVTNRTHKERASTEMR
jgi:hypothetical protein